VPCAAASAALHGCDDDWGLLPPANGNDNQGSISFITPAPTGQCPESSACSPGTPWGRRRCWCPSHLHPGKPRTRECWQGLQPGVTQPDSGAAPESAACPWQPPWRGCTSRDATATCSYMLCSRAGSRGASLLTRHVEQELCAPALPQVCFDGLGHGRQLNVPPGPALVLLVGRHVEPAAAHTGRAPASPGLASCCMLHAACCMLHAACCMLPGGPLSGGHDEQACRRAHQLRHLLASRRLSI
jgi:hypothetical protein